MSAIETAKQYWGENLPDWIEVLANESDKSSQNKIAQKIGKSSAAISQVLKNIYPGTIANIEAAVRANLMDGLLAQPNVTDDTITRLFDSNLL